MHHSATPPPPPFQAPYLVALHLVHDGFPPGRSHSALLQFLLFPFRFIQPRLQHVQVLLHSLGVGQRQSQLLQEVIHTGLQSLITVNDVP